MDYKMNDGKRQSLRVAGKSVSIDSVQLTASHSFAARERKSVFSDINRFLGSGWTKQNDRRVVSELETDSANFDVQIHAESTRSAHRPEDEFPKSRADSVDILRIKIECEMSEEINDRKKGILICRDVLTDIEQSIPWLNETDTLSATFRTHSDTEFEYNRNTIQRVSVVAFDNKIRIEEIPRSELEQSLDLLTHNTLQ